MRANVMVSFLAVSLTAAFSLCGQPAAPTVTVLTFANRTGENLTREAPGRYQTRDEVGGAERRREAFQEDGRTVETDHVEEVRRDQADTIREVADGEWQLPDGAGSLVARVLAEGLAKSGKFRVVASEMVGLGEAAQLDLAAGGEGDGAARLAERGVGYYLAGELTGFRLDHRRTTAYGVSRSVLTARVGLSVRLVRLSDGAILYQASPQESVQLTLPDGVDTTEGADWQGLLRTAGERAAQALAPELEARLGSSDETAPGGTGPAAAAPGTVRVRIGSDPAGADILINNVLVGTTPAEIDVKPGRATVRLELAEHQAWSRSVNFVGGLSLSPKLAARTATELSEEADIKVNVEHTGEAK